MWRTGFIPISAGHYLSSGFGSEVSQVSILCSVALAQGDGINTYLSCWIAPKGGIQWIGLDCFSWFALTRGFQRLDIFFKAWIALTGGIQRIGFSRIFYDFY